MGTMSYCCMQNTTSDMNVCLQEMEKCETLKDLDNEREIQYAKTLYGKCQLFVEEYERLTQK